MKLADEFGRIVGDLRISVTERCNFRCVYCLPDGDHVHGKKSDILTFEEIERLTAIFVKLGISKIRITGGEPLIRPNSSANFIELLLLSLNSEFLNIFTHYSARDSAYFSGSSSNECLQPVLHRFQAYLRYSKPYLPLIHRYFFQNTLSPLPSHQDRSKA